MKPERVWKVGDQTFDTYEAARGYAAANKKNLERRVFIDAVIAAIERCEFESASVEEAEFVADYLMARFSVKPHAKK